MQWEGKFGPAFVATVVFALIQLSVVIFGAGMIWSDVKSTQKIMSDTSLKVETLTTASQQTDIQRTKRDGAVDLAISEIKQSVAWMGQAIQKIESKMEAVRP